MSTDQKILAHFGTTYPDIAFCLGGLRRLSVNPDDLRARRMLQAYGPKFLSRQQCIIYAIVTYLPVDLFLDIGTNYGECLLALPLYSRVRARGFEANSELLPYISKSLSFNTDLKNVDIISMAVSDEPDQEIDFYVDEKWSGKSSAVHNQGAIATTKRVQTTTIDQQLLNETSIRLLFTKIDVEGFEARVMRGAVVSNARIPNLIYMLEFDSQYFKRAGEDAEAFLDSLTSAFQVYVLSASGVRQVFAYDDIPEEKPNLKHTDLIVTKFTDPDYCSAFVDNIANIDMKTQRLRLFSFS